MCLASEDATCTRQTGLRFFSAPESFGLSLDKEIHCAKTDGISLNVATRNKGDKALFGRGEVLHNLVRIVEGHESIRLDAT
jgi:hypothetical protein